MKVSYKTKVGFRDVKPTRTRQKTTWRLKRDPTTGLEQPQAVQGAGNLPETKVQFSLRPNLTSDVLFSHDDQKSCCFFLSKASSRLKSPPYQSTGAGLCERSSLPNPTNQQDCDAGRLVPKYPNRTCRRI